MKLKYGKTFSTWTIFKSIKSQVPFETQKEFVEFLNLVHNTMIDLIFSGRDITLPYHFGTLKMYKRKFNLKRSKKWLGKVPLFSDYYCIRLLKDHDVPIKNRNFYRFVAHENMRNRIKDGVENFKIII